MQAPTFLEGLFKCYTEGTDDMTCSQFIKLIQTAQLVNEEDLTKADVSSLFAKSLTAGTSRIDFSRFKETFSELAMKKKVSKNDIVKKMEALGKITMLSNSPCGLSYIVPVGLMTPSMKTGKSGVF